MPVVVLLPSAGDGIEVRSDRGVVCVVKCVAGYVTSGERLLWCSGARVRLINGERSWPGKSTEIYARDQTTVFCEFCFFGCQWRLAGFIFQGFGRVLSEVFVLQAVTGLLVLKGSRGNEW